MEEELHNFIFVTGELSHLSAMSVVYSLLWKAIGRGMLQNIVEIGNNKYCKTIIMKCKFCIFLSEIMNVLIVTKNFQEAIICLTIWR